MSLPVPEGTLDLILCLDVLEHLLNPWRVAQYLNSLLRPGGSLIVSIPNIRNRRVLLQLAIRGKWEYTESGILDRTHLRFFTRTSAIELVASAGCIVDRIEVTGGISRGRKGKLLKYLLPEWVKEFFARQYLIRGIKKR
jgi:SAM-dependent methyltransferase